MDDGEQDNEAAEIRRKEAEHRRLALAFVRDTVALEKLHLIRKCLEPEVQSMRAMLAYNQKAEDHRYMAAMLAGVAPAFRISTVLHWSRQGIFQQQLQAAARILENPECPLLPQTEATASTVFKLALRQAAVLYELVVSRCRHAFPYQLFMLLDHPEESARVIAIAREKPCVLDEFSRDFLAVYNSEQLLQGEDARQTLAAVGAQLVANTHSTERLHSRHARKAALRAQTTRMSLPDLGLCHSLRAVPPWWPNEDWLRYKEYTFYCKKSNKKRIQPSLLLMCWTQLEGHAVSWKKSCEERFMEAHLGMEPISQDSVSESNALQMVHSQSLRVEDLLLCSYSIRKQSLLCASGNFGAPPPQKNLPV